MAEGKEWRPLLSGFRIFYFYYYTKYPERKETMTKEEFKVIYDKAVEAWENLTEQQRRCDESAAKELGRRRPYKTDTEVWRVNLAGFEIYFFQYYSTYDCLTFLDRDNQYQEICEEAQRTWSSLDEALKKQFETAANQLKTYGTDEQ